MELTAAPKFTLAFFSCAAYCAAADAHIVKASKFGVFEFSTVAIHDKIFGNKSCNLSGDVVNQTDSSWIDAKFTIKILGADPSESVSYEVKVASIEFEQAKSFSVYCYSAGGQVADYPTFEPEKFVITFDGGSRHPGPEAAKREAAEARAKSAATAAAERARTAASFKTRAEYLGKFPTIQSGFSSAFIGSDRKCSSQFLEAVAMEGLEKRKRLADLVTFGCGFIVNNAAHISVESKDGQFARVKLMDTDKAGESGWIPVAWIK